MKIQHKWEGGAMKNHKRLLFGTYLIVLSIILCFLTLGLWYQDVECDHNKTKSKQNKTVSDSTSATSQKTAAKPTPTGDKQKKPAVKPNPTVENPQNAATDSGKNATVSLKDKNSENIWEINAPLYKTDIIIQPSFRLILLVLLAGALGGYVHASTSFATYIGNRSFVDSWFLWYLLRPFIGMGLALIFYFALRGGLLLLTSQPGKININPFGVGAISGLVGMFSKRASDKLAEVSETIFKTEKGKGDEERADKLREMSVSKLMLQLNNITACKLKDGKTVADFTVKDLYELYNKTVTRIPVLDDNNIVKYVIHQSLLYKFISEKSIEHAKLASGQDFKLEDFTLQDFLDFDDMEKFVGETLSFISKDETLSDAKMAMEKVENCQDVFVTETGKKGEAVLGWLTNIDISKHKKA